MKLKELKNEKQKPLIIPDIQYSIKFIEDKKENISIDLEKDQKEIDDLNKKEIKFNLKFIK